MITPGPDNASPPGGSVEISDHAIISVIHNAVRSCYGIVDMAPRSIRSAIGTRLGITVDLSVVVEYGTPIFTVAANVMQTVTFRVEEILGMKVDRVNINVCGLRISGDSGRSA